MRRQLVESESDTDDDSSMADDVKIVIHIKPKHAKNFLSPDFLANSAAKNRWENDTKTKKRPAKDHSTPAKKPRNKESKEKNSKWKCALCPRSCKTWETLDAHVQNAHEEEKNEKARESTEWKCGICEKWYCYKGNLQRHVRTAHSTKKNTAVLCGHREKKYTTKAHYVDPGKAVAAEMEKTVLTKKKENLSKYKGKVHSIAPPKKVAALTEQTVQMKDKLKEVAKKTGTDTPRVPVTKFTEYECTCGEAKDTYDASVRHAQEHLVELEALIREKGTQCELNFDRHDRGNNKKSSLIQTKFDYKALLENSWLDMFKPTEWSSAILSSSLYKYTRCVKLNWDSEKNEDGEGHCVPLYKCGACELFIEPAKVQNHCENYRACVTYGSQGHECPECQNYFYTPKALMLHKKDHDTYKNLRFRIVTFNNKDDVQFNMALRQMSLLSVENTQAKKQEKISGSPETPERNVSEKKDVHNNVARRVWKYCRLCKRSFSDLEDHSAYHNNKSKKIMETIVREQESCSAKAAEAAAKNQHGNTEKEAKPEEKVSDNDNIRKGNVQVQQHNANRIAIEKCSAVIEWNSDSDSDEDDQQSFNTLNLNPKHSGRIVTRDDEIKQKTYNDYRKLQGHRNDDDAVKEEVIEQHDLIDECELTLVKIFGEDANGIDTLDSDNESQSTIDLRRILEGDEESVLSDDE